MDFKNVYHNKRNEKLSTDAAMAQTAVKIATDNGSLKDLYEVSSIYLSELAAEALDPECEFNIAISEYERRLKESGHKESDFR